MGWGATYRCLLGVHNDNAIFGWIFGPTTVFLEIMTQNALGDNDPGSTQVERKSHKLCSPELYNTDRLIQTKMTSPKKCFPRFCSFSSDGAF